MALWVCSGEGGCGTKYAVGLFRCPRCHNTEFHEDGDPMAKISRHGGPSDKTLPAPEVESAAAAEAAPTPEAAADQPETEPAGKRVEIDLGGNGEWLDITEDLAEPVVEEGGEESSPGSSSSASTDQQPTTSEPSSKPTRKPARTTASRSRRARTENSSANGTAGGPETGTSAADSSE